MKLISHYEIRIKHTGELVGRISPSQDIVAEFAWIEALTPRVPLVLYEINALGERKNITTQEEK